MGARSFVTVFVCYAVTMGAGCAASVQAGLANAPAVPGATAETRVHDVIANGQDACERSSFPPGGVLRGQVPPCGTESRQARWAGPAASPPAPPVVSVCPGPAVGPAARSETGLVAFPAESRRLWLACEPARAR